jgi:hypothetical protein
MPHRHLLAAALALAAVACEAPEPSARTAQRPDAERVSVAPAVEARRDPGKPARPVAPALRERLVPQAVTWPAASALDHEVRGRFAEADRRAVDASGLPVLAPRDERVYAKVNVVGNATWFTVALKDADYAADLAARLAKRPLPERGGVGVYVQGNRVAHHHPNIPEATGKHTVRGRPGFITRNEMIWSASWIENGVSYVVEVECSRPDDARCADESILVDVAESLVFVGGVGSLPVAGGAR